MIRELTARRINGSDRAFSILMIVMLLFIGGGLYSVTHRGPSADAVAYTARATTSATPAPVVAPAPEVTFAAVGDGITAVNSPDFPAGQVGSESWVSLASGGGARYVGGWAKALATTKTMILNVRPVAAEVLVILAGTNDVNQDVPFATTSANLTQIVTTIGAPHVVVCSIPPVGDNLAAGNEFNAQLRALATLKLWDWVDCSAGLRAADSSYLPGLTSNGVVPNPEGEKVIAAAVHQQLLQR